MKRNTQQAIGALLCASLLGVSMLSGCSSPQPQEEEKKPEVVTKMTQMGNFTPLQTFSAQTADGKEVTSENFAAVDATLVVLWSPSDKDVMSLLQDYTSWSKMLPANIQVMTFCKDYENGGEQVLKDSGFTGTTIVSGDGHYQEFVDEASYTPMAVVLGSDGSVLSEPLGGVPNDVGSAYAKLINQSLAAEGKTAQNVAAR